MNTWLMRDARAADLPALQSWLPETLPNDLPADAAQERWWVAERLSADGSEVLGCLRLRRAIGLAQPRHWYHLGCRVHAAPELGLFQRQATLQLGNDCTGATELADIAIDTVRLTAGEQAAALRRLLRSVWLLIAHDRHGHADRVIVELPGVRNAAGQSVFWQGLGQQFYAGDPDQARRRLGPEWRGYMAALLPRQQVYLSFLPASAQAAAGRTEAAFEWLAALLHDEGLRPGQHIRIDDGGPVFEADLSTLPAVRTAVVCPLARPVAGVADPWLLLDASRGSVLDLQARMIDGCLVPVAEVPGLDAGTLVTVLPL